MISIIICAFLSFQSIKELLSLTMAFFPTTFFPFPSQSGCKDTTTFTTSKYLLTFFRKISKMKLLVIDNQLFKV